MDFLKNFNKELSQMEGISTSSEPPTYWHSSGSVVLNKIISDNYTHGIPQGRITALAGDSGCGKSYLAANLAKNAQLDGAFCLIIDSENALDNTFMTKIGVDVTQNYQYVSVSTISEVTTVISKFLKGYKTEVGTNPDAQPLFILVDSLSMLLTDTELENYDKGVTKGDQGQKNKQLKAMLKNLVHSVKTINASVVCTSSVYANQDILNGLGKWIVPDAIKYACSQIILIQKRKLKDESKDAKAGDFCGVRMICEGYKTRFARPFQKVEIEVPYEIGMDAYSGLVEVAVKAGVLVKRGSRLSIVGKDETWYAKDIDQHATVILQLLQSSSTTFFDTEGEVESSGDSDKERKQQKYGTVKDLD